MEKETKQYFLQRSVNVFSVQVEKQMSFFGKAPPGFQMIAPYSKIAPNFKTVPAKK